MGRLKYKYSEANQRTASVINLGAYNTVAIFKRVYEKIATESPLLLDILSLLRIIDDTEKIRRFMREAKYNEKIMERGKFSVSIVSRNFAARVSKDYIVLQCRIKDDSKAKRVIETLRNKYGEIIIRKYGSLIMMRLTQS